MKQNVTNLSPKVAKNYSCDICNYNTCKITDLKKHLQTNKHKIKENETNVTNLSPKVAENLSCVCGRYFNNRTTHWRHKKNCNNNEDNEYMYQGIDINDKDALVLHLLKQNGELQNKIIEIASQSTIISNNNNHNTTNNIDNKTFNLQFFLNDTCKDAMNISEFVSSINFNLEDLEHTGRAGYIEGISNIVIHNLNKLEKHMRPLHCSDNKREVLYIKDNNEWTKESASKPILTKTIKTIANENIKQISKWTQKYPDCTKSDSKKNDLYLKIVSNSMNGLTKEEGEQNISKIISNVAKKVVIEK